MSNIYEVKGNLFSCKYIFMPNVAIAHCVSADYALGAGFAREIENRYSIRNKLKQIGSGVYPDSIYCDSIINIVTKQNYWNKPTYETFTLALIKTLSVCKEHNVKLLIMPRIGCGLDKLDWDKCREIIKNELVDNGIDCIVYSL